MRCGRFWLLGVAALAAGCAGAPAVDPAVTDVALRTQEFLAALPPAQRADATRTLDDRERTSWAFVPGRYAGVEFGELDATATARAHDLLRAVLSTRGVATTLAIVELEAVLRAIESRGGRDASHRDPGRYALLVCGEPAPRGAFSVRLQGHHVSLHFTFFDGWLVGCTPHFLGSNPHEQREGEHAGTRALAAEEDLARELLAALDDAQRTRAVIAATAPADVLLVPGRGPDALGERRGLPAAAMTARQRATVLRLVEQFVGRLRGEFAQQELARLRPTLDDVVFAWAGGVERGQPHYWRLHGTTFALEYDNTQNDANHVHVVWRDFERDFGGDPLRAHLDAQHRR